jgi:hypothetical protein
MQPAQGAGRGFAFANPLPAHAQGIAAESPQDLHLQIRGLGAESPFFAKQKCARKDPLLILKLKLKLAQ